jgi:hypothetical protein
MSYVRSCPGGTGGLCPITNVGDTRKLRVRIYLPNQASINIFLSAASFSNNSLQEATKMVYDENFEEIPHLFVPSEERGYSRISLSELVVYTEPKSVSQLRLHPHSQPRPVLDEFTMVVHIDGACRGIGTPTAQSSYGVYSISRSQPILVLSLKPWQNTSAGELYKMGEVQVASKWPILRS